MSLGIKQRVLIMYLEFDVEKISKSIIAYSPDIIITFHDIFSNKSEYPTRQRFADFIQKRMNILRPSAKYMNFSVENHEYQSYAKSLESSIDFVNVAYEKPEIFINISAGPNEFSAAAAVSSVVHDNVTIFSTRELESAIPIDIAEKMFCKNSEPFDSSSKIADPSAIYTYKSELPSKPLVLGLRLLDEKISSGKPLMAKEMVSLFIENNIWMREKPSANDNVFYLRDFVDRWIANGWVEKGQLRNQYRVTLKGKMIIDTYYNVLEQSF